MSQKEATQLVISAVEDLKGKDIVCLDVSSMTGITDQMIIASGSSTQHVRSIAQNIIYQYKQNIGIPVGVEGEDTGEWVLVDLGSTVAHIMMPATRAFYDLESLWTLGDSDPVEEDV